MHGDGASIDLRRLWASLPDQKESARGALVGSPFHVGMVYGMVWDYGTIASSLLFYLIISCSPSFLFFSLRAAECL